jgi:ferrous iron transport protein B
MSANSASQPATALTNTRYVVLTGNPNAGKTTLFNALTGLRAKVGNYPGVTVERKEGRMLHAPKESVIILDLPGTYSLSPQSLDEQISRDVLFHRVPEVPPPSMVVVVVDASNLQRNLYFTTQVIELGYPTVVALNMVDVAKENGQIIDAEHLSQALGVPVVPIVASAGDGIVELRRNILSVLADPEPQPAACRAFCKLPGPFNAELDKLTSQLKKLFPGCRFAIRAEALLALTDEKCLASNAHRYPEDFLNDVYESRAKLDKLGIDWHSGAIEARYAWITEVQLSVTTDASSGQETMSDKLDRIATHKTWGIVIFAVLMALMFQSIFTLAKFPMEWIQAAIDAVGAGLTHVIPQGALQDLLVRGIVKGVGAVVVFMPQICLLFAFIGILEDTGYMARAAFLMDRMMSKVGLHGKSFIPMLSSFACAIPGIMATRTIETPKDRLVTILVAPLMSCSARLPVYTLLIAACIPNRRMLGFLRLPGATLFGMYLLGITFALLMAWLFKKTLLKGPTPLLIMELPPYKRPVARVIFHHMWDRSKLFLRRAGTVILGINVLLWFVATYPKNAATEQDYAAKRAAIQQNAPDATAQLTLLNTQEMGERLRGSFAGRMGRMLEPVIAPLGFDWKMGIGIVSSFAAREVFVSTMSLVYEAGDEEGGAHQSMAQKMHEQLRPDGTPVYTTLLAISLMVFYVFALQCASTVVVVRRETNSWKWPLFQFAYMSALAWIFAFITYQGGKLLGWG